MRTAKFKKNDYLGEIEKEFENTLACLSVAHADWVESWKTLSSKISWHSPFKTGLDAAIARRSFHIVVIADNFTLWKEVRLF